MPHLVSSTVEAERKALSPGELILFVLICVLPSWMLAIVGGYVARKYASAFGLLDQPNQRKVHRNPIPLGGGITIWLALVFPFAIGQLLLWLISAEMLSLQSLVSDDSRLAWIVPHISGVQSQMPNLWKLILGATILMLLGLWDDLRGLSWQFRIVVQACVAVAIASQGWQLTFFTPIPWLNFVVTVLWIVGLINSLNMLDNMDGLSAGVAAIAGGMFGLVMLFAFEPAQQQPQLFVAGMLFVFVGSLLGFLWHNFSPAKLFMGDAGSYLIGYWLAISTILATFRGSEEQSHTFLAPLFVLAVPLYDTVTVIWIRLRQGISPFKADKNHFSHRLVKLGMTTKNAVLTIYLLTLITGLAALLLYQVETLFAAIVLTLVVFSILILVRILEHSASER